MIESIKFSKTKKKDSKFSAIDFSITVDSLKYATL